MTREQFMTLTDQQKWDAYLLLFSPDFNWQRDFLNKPETVTPVEYGKPKFEPALMAERNELNQRFHQALVEHAKVSSLPARVRFEYGDDPYSVRVVIEDEPSTDEADTRKLDMNGSLPHR